MIKIKAAHSQTDRKLTPDGERYQKFSDQKKTQKTFAETDSAECKSEKKILIDQSHAKAGGRLVVMEQFIIYRQSGKKMKLKN